MPIKGCVRVSSSEFRQILLQPDTARGDRLLRAAISAFCALARPSRREIAQIEDLEYRIAAIRTELALRASLPLPLLEQEARARHSASTAQTAPSAVDSVSAGLR